MAKINVYQVTESSPAILRQLKNLLIELHPGVATFNLKEDIFKLLIKSNDKALFVAEIDNKIVGTATLNTIYGLTNNKAWLRDFIVKKGYRKQGVGGILWQEIIKWCDDRGLDLIFSTNQDNIEAQRFYQKQGAKKLSTNQYAYKIK